jgi:uncharacterized protein involved in exopolysaccharide biosynthesis
MKRLAVILAEHRRLFITVFVVGTGLMGVYRGLIKPPRFNAEVTLVVNTAEPGKTGQLGSLTDLAGLAGIQLNNGRFTATPEMVEGMLTSRRVQLGVAMEPWKKDLLVIDAITDSAIEHDNTRRIVEAMQKAVTVSSDKQTGWVTLSVENEDSALARFVNNRLVDSLRATFVATAKAQAEAQRKGQAKRLDSAKKELRDADERIQNWITLNGDLGPRARGNIERGRLENEVQMARAAYAQAMADYSSAVARELDQTPAVVVFDQLPKYIEMKPKFTLLISLLVGFALVSCLVAFYYARESYARFVSGRPVSEAEAEARLRAALGGEARASSEPRSPRRDRVGV